jgi:hypothetical protein
VQKKSPTTHCYCCLIRNEILKKENYIFIWHQLKKKKDDEIGCFTIQRGTNVYDAEQLLQPVFYFLLRTYTDDDHNLHAENRKEENMYADLRIDVFIYSLSILNEQ